MPGDCTQKQGRDREERAYAPSLLDQSACLNHLRNLQIQTSMLNRPMRRGQAIAQNRYYRFPRSIWRDRPAATAAAMRAARSFREQVANEPETILRDIGFVFSRPSTRLWHSSPRPSDCYGVF